MTGRRTGVKYKEGQIAGNRKTDNAANYKGECKKNDRLLA